ncbi:GNAT family N-acetyltransferase [Siculibacillus lacustris]|uniref:GNAT family N-acetyltransferase n=1 Tax=Siculibacillus lacustris TaxID=1549641 RepID=A0A4Q9VRF6_9HYPH|nr:GNAT family N-acetyltransferase [Siculibacillus lacustris]TBW38194.1 GNAT family N-acetyltransferase [Siculibacillus lacustris]
MTVVVRPLVAADRPAWEPLWAAYQRFYEVALPPTTTDLTWSRFLDPAEPMTALGAFDGERLVGIVHAIFHRSCWLPTESCYLQDLFVDPDHRGAGTGGALIAAVAALARARDVPRVHWLTREDNATARRLYDAVATRSGFIQYRLDV